VPAMARLVASVASPHDVQVGGVFLERQGPRPKQGVTSTYSTGVGYGLWRGLIGGALLPLVVVQPVSWRRTFGLIGQGKPASLRVATERFPTQFPPQLGRHHGAADAVLIAVFGYLHAGPKDARMLEDARGMRAQRGDAGE